LPVFIVFCSSQFIHKEGIAYIMFYRVLITLIIVGVVVQNTCPQGWAAKTAFVSCTGSHCPMKEHSPTKTKDQTDARKDVPNVNQSFVLDIERRDNAFQILAQTNQTSPIGFPSLKEIFSDPLFRPPIPSSLS
jgi:hypothetical protein